MDHRSPSFEATLLYKTAQNMTLAPMLDQLRPALNMRNERVLQIEKIDALYSLIHCPTMKVLISVGAETLPLDGFVDALQPSGAPDVFSDLLSVQGHMTVMLVDDASVKGKAVQNRRSMMLQLCQDLVLVLQSATNPSFVFWADTDTLMTAEQFAGTCMDQDDLTTGINALPQETESMPLTFEPEDVDFVDEILIQPTEEQQQTLTIKSLTSNLIQAAMSGYVGVLSRRAA